MASQRYVARKSGDYWIVWDTRHKTRTEGPPHVNKATAAKYAGIMNRNLNQRLGGFLGFGVLG